LNLGRLRRAILAAHPFDCSRPSSLFTPKGRQARRAEGAPLMIVKKILTAST
jgi:hypothetical protein